MVTATKSAQRGQPQQLRIAGGHTGRKDINVNETERWVSLVGGGAVAAYGLTRGDLLGLALAVGGGFLLHRGLTGHCMGYAALGVSTTERHGSATSVAAGHGVKVERTMTINAPPDKLYKFWRKLENLPQFMHHLESVTVNGDISHWVAKGPLGKRVEWDAQIINDKPNEVIAWKSLEGSMVDNAGSVHFTKAPGGRGTEVRVVLKYDPPAGKVGDFIAWMFRKSADQEVKEELRHFKQLMETGEVATVEGQTSCRLR
jgi:uncharacterized membrane protein